MTVTIKISDKGAFDLATAEALVIAPYYDSAGVLTWGIGHTASAGEPDPARLPDQNPANVEATMREAWLVFQADLASFTADVVEVLGPKLKQHELDGWVSWHLNTGGVRRTSAVDMWKRGDKAGAVRKLQSWNKVTVRGQKVVSAGLVKRRAREAALILNGQYHGGKLRVIRTNGKRRLANDIALLDSKSFFTMLGVAAPRNAPHSVPAREVARDLAIPGAIAGGIAGIVTFWDQIKEAFSWLSNLLP